jgi:hypothetical protein
VPSTVIDQNDVRAGERQPRRLKLLVFLPSIAYYRIFEGLLGALSSAGHQVVLALDHERREVPPENAHLLAERLPRRNGPWRIAASATRRSLDYMRYLDHGYADAGPLRDQARNQAPRALRALLVLPPFRWELGRRPLAWLLRRIEAGIPLPRDVKSFISEQSPDVVLVSPLVEFGSDQAEYVRASQSARIPSVLVVARDGDLTRKGALRDVPTLTITSSGTRLDEAALRQSLPRERIVAVGPAGMLGGIERAARMEVVARRRGRLLRPLLWLLTPLLSLVLLVFRPRATTRDVVKAARRLRRRTSRRGAGRPKALARAAKEERRARTEAARQEKAARAKLKGRERALAESAKQAKATQRKTERADAARVEAGSERENPGG